MYIVTTPMPTFPRLLDGDLHRLSAQEDAEPAGRVDRGRRGRLPDYAPLGARRQLAFPVLLDVGAEHVRHAVRLDAPQVGHGQDVCALGRRFGRLAHTLEYGRHRLPERLLRDADLVFPSGA